MQKTTKPPTADSKMAPLADEDILDFAEEVLGSDTEDIIALDEETTGVSDQDDDIIDLTEMSDMPAEEDEDILDLTDELEEDVPEESDIMALEEDTAAGQNFDDEILDLNAAIDELSGQEEEILDLEELAEEPGESDDEIVVLDEVAQEPPVIAAVSKVKPSEFSIETDTIELTEADRKALEEEFGLEPETLGDLTDFENQAPQSGSPDAALDLDAGSSEMQETIDLESPAELGPEDPAAPVFDAGIDEEVLELSDSDQESLEEELKIDFIDDDKPAGPSDRQTKPGRDDVDMRFDFNSEDLKEPFEAGESPGPDAIDNGRADEETEGRILELTEEDAVALEDVLGSDFESELPADTPAPSTEAFDGETDDARFVTGEDGSADTIEMGEAGESAIEEIQEEILDLDELESTGGDALGPMAADTAKPEPPAEDEIQFAPEETDLKDTVEMTDVKAPAVDEFPPETLALDEEEPAGDHKPSAAAETAPVATEQDLAEDLGLDIEPDAGSEDRHIGGDSSPAAAPYGAESLETGELDSPSGEGDFIESLGMTIDSDTGLAGAFNAAGDRTVAAEEKELTVDFDQTDAPGHKELHKVGDPISIRVKEPAFENHANEDDLLNQVFQSEAAPVSTERLEQTVEKVVAKVLAEKVEVLLVDAIERAVTKEIERLKAQLLGTPDRDA